jgi:hypothetical protein
MDFTKGFMKEKRLVGRALFVYLFSSVTVRQKKMRMVTWSHLSIICEYCNNFKVVRKKK